MSPEERIAKDLAKNAKMHGQALGAALKKIRLSRGYDGGDFASNYGFPPVALKTVEDSGVGFAKYAKYYLNARGMSCEGLEADALEQAVLEMAANIPKPLDQALFSKALGYLLLADGKISKDYVSTLAGDFLGVAREALQSILLGNPANPTTVNKIVRNYKFESEQELLKAAIERGFSPDVNVLSLKAPADATEKFVARVTKGGQKDPNGNAWIFAK